MFYKKEQYFIKDAKRGISCDGSEYCLNESEDWECILIISGFGHGSVRSWGLTLFCGKTGNQQDVFVSAAE